MRTFDRLVSFDERSRAFPIRTVVPKVPRSYSWAVNAQLDQGDEGACVGFAWTHELAAKPAVNDVTYDAARSVYLDAQRVDEWAGESYSGTSVLAGAKVIKQRGYMAEYRWCFGLEDLRLAVGHAGPCVLGVNWYEGMFDVDADGYVHASGYVAGGHAILAYGVSQKGRFFRLHNSWGEGWGQRGTCKISFDDMQRLLREDGEACCPVGRKRMRPQAAG